MNRAASATERPEFVHEGLRLEQPDPLAVERALGEPALEVLRHGPKPWRSAIRSTAMKPTLWRWRAWRSPGLPSPTKSFIGERRPRRGSGWPASRPVAAVASVTTVGGTIEQIVKSRSVIVGLTPCGQRDVADVDRIADLAAGEVDHQLARDRIGRAGQLDVAADDVEHAAALEPGRLVLVHEPTGTSTWITRAGLGAQEVDMQRIVADRVELRLARQDLEPLAAEVELEHRAEEARVRCRARA